MKARGIALLITLVLLAGIPALAFTGGFSARDASTDAGNPAAELAMASGLPVISVVTENGALPDGEDARARLTVYRMEEGSLRTISSRIEIRERGNTSRRFPKKSYRVKIVDESGEKANLSLLGLRSDDDWILNPMYTDTSKIREALAYRLWADINSSSNLAAGSRFEYAEVYLNGEYWGLYGLQERIDRKQVEGDKRSGVIYKIIANDKPEVNELLSCTDDEICRGFELAFSGAGVTRPWDPAAAYMAILNGEQTDVRASLSLENTIDYGLWAMLCQAHDCRFKNQFINCVYGDGGYTLYKIPWDLNNTFADVWKSDSRETNYTDYRIGTPVVDEAFRVLLAQENAQVYEMVRGRWAALRSAWLTEENLISMAYELYTPIIVAIERDSARWPECGMGNGNAVNIRDIEGYIRRILPIMDQYINSLGIES